MNNETTGRAAFEAWWQARFPADVRDSLHADELAFEIWQAARATLPQPSGEPVAWALLSIMDPEVTVDPVLADYWTRKGRKVTALASLSAEDVERAAFLKSHYEQMAKEYASIAGYNNKLLVELAAYRGQQTISPATPPTADSAADARDAVRNAIAAQLVGTYYCGRVWSAWQVGTMREDDFTPAEEVDEVLDDITDAVIAAMHPTTGKEG